MDFTSLGIGFIVGVIVTSMAIEFGLRKLLTPKQDMRLTALWRISDVITHQPPLIVVEDIRGVPIPAGSRIIVKEVSDTIDRRIFAAGQVRINPDVKTNFAIGEEKLLVFTSAPMPGVMALWTSNDAMHKRLKSEFDRLWTGSQEYIEKIQLSEVAGKVGVPVITKGAVIEAIPHGKQWLLTVSDHGQTALVISNNGAELKNKKAIFIGKIEEINNTPVLMAERVKA